MKRIDARPLSTETYAAYGDVVAASPRGEAGKPANQGTARRYDRVAALANLRGSATPNLCVFRCTPAAARPVPIAMLEKHPGSTQVFVPMNARRYLVVVALGVDAEGGRGDAPDLGTLAAFVASGTQGVTYRPGVWHHPMIALDAPIDFACLVWEDDSPGDCVAVSLADEARVEVLVDG